MCAAVCVCACTCVCVVVFVHNRLFVSCVSALVCVFATVCCCMSTCVSADIRDNVIKNIAHK